MSEEIKGKFEFPMMPIFGVDLGERLGELSAGQRQLRGDIQKLDARLDRMDDKIDALDAKFEAKTDKMAYAVNRLDERTRNMTVIGGGILIAVLASIVVQIFSK